MGEGKDCHLYVRRVGVMRVVEREERVRGGGKGVGETQGRGKKMRNVLKEVPKGLQLLGEAG